MDIACPNCNAAYRVPDALLLQRKPLRCAACGHAWVPELPAEAPPLPVVPLRDAAAASTAPPAAPEPPPAPSPTPAPTPAPAPVTPPPGAPRPASLPPEAEPQPALGSATPPPLIERKFPPGPGARRIGREEAEEDAPDEEAPRPRRQRRRLSGALLLFAWLLSLAVIGGTLAVLFVFRADVADAWRPFLRVVDVIGG
jgi:predicted Zn finger-like uncharacterized protein